MEFWWIYPIAGSFLLSVIFTEITRLIAIRFHILDDPKLPRKHHKKPIPLLGGLGIYTAISIIVLLVLYFTGHLTEGDMQPIHFIGYLLGGLVLMIGGVLDDKYGLRARYSIIFPILAALIAIAAGIGVSKVTNPLGGAFTVLPWVSSVFTFIWLLGMTYTTKLLDGMDGLATGVSSIAALMIGGLALSSTYFQPDAALLAFIIFAALFGFLLWNSSPAQIFLGEAGSTFIGFTIGVLSIIAGAKIGIAMLILGVPAFDIVFVMIDRARNGRPLFAADRRHLHHKLMDIGFSQRQVVTFYYAIALMFGIVALLFSSIGKLLALFILFIIISVLAFFISKIKNQKTI